jgi:hypothetical protein
MKISVVPFYEHFLQNRLFQFTNTWTNHWQEGNVALFQESQCRGYTLGTWDQLPVEDADIVVFLDYPATRETVIQAKQRAPGALMVLMLYETPLYNPHWFEHRNHALFDAILTYNPHLVDGQRYFQMHLPIGSPPQLQSDLPFEDRSPLVMINTNCYVGLRAAPLPWHWLNRRRDLEKAGWHCTLTAGVSGERGDLNRARRRLARVAEQRCADAVDLFGRGWAGRKSGWYYRFLPDPPYQLAKGQALEDKLQLLSRYRYTIAYENYEGDVGYISEKIFDALYAGTVPIYRGDRNIAKSVWPECFIDSRQFRNEAELLNHVLQLPKQRWLEMQEAGKQYLNSEQIKHFQADCYVNSILSVIESIATRSPKPIAV